MGQGRIQARPLISHRISLDELPAMFERMRSPTDQIKVIVEP
jgi:threonine dehydrogenase-like Zn-dependent dehydrogenase